MGKVTKIRLGEVKTRKVIPMHGRTRIHSPRKPDTIDDIDDLLEELEETEYDLEELDFSAPMKCPVCGHPNFHEDWCCYYEGDYDE